MTSKFKAGDKVVRTEHYSWASDNNFMQQGKEYIVNNVYVGGNLDLIGSDATYVASKFKLVEEKPKFKNMKFRVSSPEQSKEIQEVLLSMGYDWAGKDQQVMYLDSKWLTSWDDGSLGTEEHAFNLNKGEEYTIKTTKSYELIPVEIPKEELVELMGQKYSKKELEDALRSLKPVE